MFDYIFFNAKHAPAAGGSPNLPSPSRWSPCRPARKKGRVCVRNGAWLRNSKQCVSRGVFCFGFGLI